jgi:hypothetical protein
MKQLEKMNFIKINVKGLDVKYSLDEAIQEIVSRYATFPVSAAGRI